MDVIRTPDAQFTDLPDFPFDPHYAVVPIDASDPHQGTLRVHYLDEGPSDGEPVLLLHGEPTWGYLYRHMIPPLVEAGHRVIVPDLVGFGRSDKPMHQPDYTYARHVAWMSSLVFDVLDLTGITFFGQDWGGLIGLRLVAAQPDRYARVVIGNTGLPTGHGPASEAFLAWQKYSQEAPALKIGEIVGSGCVSGLPPEVVAAYDAPFPDDRFKAGARIFPTLVPTRPDDPASADNQAAWEVLARFERPFVLAYSDGDPVTRGGDAPFLAKVPGAQSRSHTTIAGAGHFLQEDAPTELVKVILACIAAP
jgi:haloalkane dehalogenase